jgi:hypothetical protein
MPRTPNAVLEAAAVAAIVPGTTYYLSGHTGDPGTTGANELTGGGYARQPIVFAAGASDGIIASNAAQTMPNAGSTAVTHFGIWTASTAGTYMTGGALTSSVTAASISFGSGAVTVTVA